MLELSRHSIVNRYRSPLVSQCPSVFRTCIQYWFDRQCHTRSQFHVRHFPGAEIENRRFLVQISPDTVAVGRSVDGLVMVLLGGLQTLAGPVVGAVTFTWLQDAVARNTDYWRALLGGIILLLVLVFPQGIAGFAGGLFDRMKNAHA